MVTTEENQSLRTKPPLMPKISTGGQPAFKRQALSILSPNPLWTYKPMEHHFTLLILPISEVFNTINNRELNARDQSGTIPYLPEQKNIAHTMTVRNTRPSIAEHFESNWKSSSNKAFSKCIYLLPKQPPDPDNSTLHCLPASHNTWSPNTKQLSDFILPRDMAVLLSLPFPGFQFSGSKYRISGRIR